jgi:putative molybdopterin biosynthesis protein
MNESEGASHPLPRVARERWLDALARAGWSPRPGARRSADGTGTGAGAPGGGQEGPGGGADGPGSERVPVGDALGRVTAAPVIARWPSPRADCAAMDGIAVRAADLAAAAARDSAAGDAPDGGTGDRAPRLAAGQFEWIDTGDPMPAGADTVVVRERLLPQADGSVIVTAAGAAAGHGHRAGHAAGKRNVRAAGEDFAAGDVLVPAGRRLRPGDLAAAAAGGHVTVAVVCRPVVAIIPTGDEIRPAGSTLRYGDIADTNSIMLAARCRQLGAVPVVSAVIPDDPDTLATELRRAAAHADLVLVIAGSSRGRGDHAGAVLAQVGGVAVAGIAVRPGHPALLGHAKRPAAGAGHAADPAPPADHRAGIAPVIGLPGYPLATAVIFELFAAPLLEAIQGRRPAGDVVRARLDRDWASRADVEDWVLVTLTPDAGGGLPLATPARRGAGSISLLARSDAWWPIPAGQGTVAAGTEIGVLPVPGTG